MSGMTWESYLARSGPVITDGGWGTQFALRGLRNGEAPEAWNLLRPADVSTVAAAYASGGSEIILTNTFGGTPLKLRKSGVAGDPSAINRAGVELSRQGAGSGTLVFADLGPTGELLEPYGGLAEKEGFRQFQEQAAALLAAGPDGFVIETMTDLNEALIALRAVRSVAPHLPVVVSMTYQKIPGGYATIMGQKPDQAVAALRADGASAVGANCGAGMEEMIGLATELTGTAGSVLPIWVKPNAGLPELDSAAGRTVYRETPEQFAAAFGRLVSAGAKFTGGCCGTTPDHIRALVAARSGIFPK